jgi:hypothetical protein
VKLRRCQEENEESMEEIANSRSIAKPGQRFQFVLPNEIPPRGLIDFFDVEFDPCLQFVGGGDSDLTEQA